MDVVLRAFFFAVIRPLGVVLRLRGDRLALRQPESTNWRAFEG